MPDTNSSAATASPTPVDVGKVAEEARALSNVIRSLGVRVLSAGSRAVEAEWTLSEAEQTILTIWRDQYKELSSALQQQGLRWHTANLIEARGELLKSVKCSTADLEIVLDQDQKRSAMSRRESLKSLLDSRVRVAKLLETLPQLWKRALKGEPSRVTILSELWVKQNLSTKGDHMMPWDAARFCKMCSHFSEDSDSASQSVYHSLLTAAQVSKNAVDSLKSSALAWSTVSELDRGFVQQYDSWSQAGYPDQPTITTGTDTQTECIMQ